MKTNKYFLPLDRYHFDCGKCRGWAQLDTTEDAHYYGHWANPHTLEMVSYVEGDVCEKKAETAEEFTQMINDWFKWATEAGMNPNIDGMCNDNLIAAFGKLGLGGLLK